MRTLFCLAVMLLTGIANAGPIWHQNDYTGGERSYVGFAIPNASPLPLRVKLFSTKRPDQPLFWHVAMVNTENVGTTWRLDETTAPSFGFDWAALEDLVAFPQPTSFHLVTKTEYANHFNVYSIYVPGLYGMDPDWFEISLIKLAFDPVDGKDGQYLRMTTKTHVSYSYAEIVPEPSSAMLLVIGLLLVHQYAPNCLRYRCRT